MNRDEFMRTLLPREEYPDVPPTIWDKARILPLEALTEELWGEDTPQFRRLTAFLFRNYIPDKKLPVALTFQATKDII